VKPSAPTSSGLQPLQPLDDGPLSLSPLGAANPFGSASPLDLQPLNTAAPPELQPLNTASPLDLQPLGGGSMGLQPLGDLQPMAAAPTPAALMAPAPYVAPAAKPTAWGAPRRTAFVSWAGMVCMAAGAAYVVRALLWAVNTTTVFASRPQFTPEHARTAAAVAMVVGAVGVVFALVVAIPYVLAGFAILGRKNWGKILGVVCGGFSCLVGLFFLFTLFRELNSYVNFARFVPLPMSFHLRLLGGILFDAIFVGLLVAQAAMAFMLLGERRSHEFR
jgi:hypothetical protein